MRAYLHPGVGRFTRGKAYCVEYVRDDDTIAGFETFYANDGRKNRAGAVATAKARLTGKITPAGSWLLPNLPTNFSLERTSEIKA